MPIDFTGGRKFPSTRELLKEQVLHEVVKAISKLGTCNRSKVGAIIVRNGRILSTGYNGSPPGKPHCLDIGCAMRDGHCIACLHAETNALLWAAREGIAVKGAKIYVHGWLTGGDLGICPTCNMAAQAAGIVETVIVPYDEEN